MYSQPLEKRLLAIEKKNAGHTARMVRPEEIAFLVGEVRSLLAENAELRLKLDQYRDYFKRIRRETSERALEENAPSC